MAKTPPSYHTPPSQPTDLAQVRQIKEIIKRLFGSDSNLEEYHFSAGEVLVHERDALVNIPALLIVEGEIHARMTDLVPGQGVFEQTWYVAHAGDIVNVQSVLPNHKDQPALCSFHAVTDGYGVLLRETHLDQLQQFGVLFSNLFRMIVMLLQKDREYNRLYGGFYRLSDLIRGKHPQFELPHEPKDIIRRFAELKREQQQAAEYADQLMAKLRTADEQLSELNKERHSLRRRVGEERQEVVAAHAHAEQLKEQLRKLEMRLEFQQRIQKALETKTTELIQTLAGQDTDSKFPSALQTLSEMVLQTFQKDTELYREAAAHENQLADAARKEKEDYERRARLLHKAVELLAKDNPDLEMREDVMRLMLGEEPPPREESTPAAAPQEPEAPPEPSSRKLGTLPYLLRRDSTRTQGAALRIPRAQLPTIPDGRPLPAAICPPAARRSDAPATDLHEASAESNSPATTGQMTSILPDEDLQSDMEDLSPCSFDAPSYVDLATPLGAVELDHSLDELADWDSLAHEDD